jgi:Aspartyl/Asparaginyl beta-hydroxylase
MKHFKVLKTDIEVAPFIQELDSNSDLWGMVASLENVGGDKNPYGFLPLTMGIQFGNQDTKDSEYQADTPAKRRFPLLNQWLLENNFSGHSRAAFFKLAPNGNVLPHIDDGKYYLTRNRYHLSLQGQYLYSVDNEEMVINPGTLFWFNNKKVHSAKNISNVDRITFVFDVPYA